MQNSENPGKFRSKVISTHILLLVLVSTIPLLVFYAGGLGSDSLVIAIFLIPVVLHLLAIWGLKARKSWARTFSAIIAIFYLFGFPIGTIFGISILYNLSKDKAEEGPISN